MPEVGDLVKIATDVIRSSELSLFTEADFESLSTNFMRRDDVALVVEHERNDYLARILVNGQLSWSHTDFLEVIE